MSLIILERDGVINATPADFISTPSEWEPLEGSLEAIAKLNQAGFRIIVIANDNGIAQGSVKIETVTAIHSKMRRMLAQLGGRIDAVLFCRSGDETECETPFEHSFSELSHRLRLDLSRVPAVGCSTLFIQAAKKMKASVMLIQTDEGKTMNHHELTPEVRVFDSLQSVTDWLLDVEE